MYTTTAIENANIENRIICLICFLVLREIIFIYGLLIVRKYKKNNLFTAFINKTVVSHFWLVYLLIKIWFMNKISSPLTYIPIRSEPSHQSEQVSQLIFGETATVINVKNEWYFIKTDFDSYQGWIEKKVTIDYKKEHSEKIVCKSFIFSADNNLKIIIPVGAQVSFNSEEMLVFNGTQCNIKIDKFSFEPDFLNVIHEFISAPYLWGGCTPFGTDCSGFTQIVMKCQGVKLPRDAWQQANIGSLVENINLATEGDLAFFSNDEGKVVHVGIILHNQQIVHASGSVRVDKIDSNGILNESIGIYTHKLHSIKRLK
jgi:gamma-D-glutamyl-L-lysine dipeptidyl-peptidase